jgi:multidrug efflux pump subunit AcrB
MIVLLLARTFSNARQVMPVVLSLPRTLLGGLGTVALTGSSLTISSMMWFVALFGMAARNAIARVLDHLPETARVLSWSSSPPARRRRKARAGLPPRQARR